MCLAFVAFEEHQDYPLLLLFNRDENYTRKAKTAHWWEEEDIFAGRDLQKGGTWAAVGRSSKFALLTFVRAPREDLTPTIARGEIVPTWMRTGLGALEFSKMLRRDASQTLGYNLFFGDQSHVFHYNNRSDILSELGSGIHGVSNGDMPEPWFKVRRGQEAISEMLLEPPDSWPAQAFEILQDGTLAPDGQVQVTGLNPDRERLKSGTVCEP